MKKILIVCQGFIGDILLQSSVAKKLKQKYEGCIVDFIIPLAQPLLLLERNPYINTVYVDGLPNTPTSQQIINTYNKMYYMPVFSQDRPATIQSQLAADVEDTSVEYEVYTVPEYDVNSNNFVDGFKKLAPNCPVVAWQSNWTEKAYQTTPEQYIQKIGGPHRDVERIIKFLSQKFIMVEVGLKPGKTQADNQDPDLFATSASMIKACDFMIGSEGGLTNLAAGLGVRCIITTDYIYQLYGKYGHVRQFDNPMMGPKTYFPNRDHYHLEPFISDEEVARRMEQIIIERVIQ